MARRRSQKHDNAKTCDNSWSELNHDVLFLVMMHLGIVDFLACSRVCKSWRSFTLSNRNTFMAESFPITTYVNEEECHLEDFKGRKFKTAIPHCDGRTFYGECSGYLILFGAETRDFWLVNPITRHELHFPAVTFDVNCGSPAVLVFSLSISEWVFVISNKYSDKIWFSIAGKGAWTHIFCPFSIEDFHVFKGKIYILHFSICLSTQLYLSEMRLYPDPKLMLLETNNILDRDFMFPVFVSSAENLYVVDWVSCDRYNIHELDLDEKKWVLREKTTQEYAFFLSNLKRGSISGQRKGGFFNGNMWYLFNDYLEVNLLPKSWLVTTLIFENHHR